MSTANVTTWNDPRLTHALSAWLCAKLTGKK
jgi:hypothetical protein